MRLLMKLGQKSVASQNTRVSNQCVWMFWVGFFYTDIMALITIDVNRVRNCSNTSDSVSIQAIQIHCLPEHASCLCCDKDQYQIYTVYVSTHFFMIDATLLLLTVQTPYLWLWLPTRKLSTYNYVMVQRDNCHCGRVNRLLWLSTATPLSGFSYRLLKGFGMLVLACVRLRTLPCLHSSFALTRRTSIYRRIVLSGTPRY